MDPNTLKLLMGSSAAGAVADKLYIEDVFSTWLYTGTQANQTITNGIDLSGKGGLVWLKSRTSSNPNVLFDTARGTNQALRSNASFQQEDLSANNTLTSFNSTGFALGNDLGFGGVNSSPDRYVSWTFRKAAKFFDVVTWTGDGATTKTINHSLGSVPGFIVSKAVSTTGNWRVYHRSLSSNAAGLALNSTQAGGINPFDYGNGTTVTTPTSTTFTAGQNINSNGVSYVAYLFAHDAGGFGDSGNDNVISCGIVTANASGFLPEVNLGWEPQWILSKRVDFSFLTNWDIVDILRGMPTASSAILTSKLLANTSDSEGTNSSGFTPTSTGFVDTTGYNANERIIYIAIRRGPMKTPTDATKVFSVSTSSANTGTITSGFPTDFSFSLDRSSSGLSPFSRGVADRLRGKFLTLGTDSSTAESSNTSTVSFDSNTGIILNGGSVYLNGYVHQQFRRAPGFFDVVAYTGTGSNRTVTHNLAVIPELIIIKWRDASGSWSVYNAASGATKFLLLNATLSQLTSSFYWNDTAPTSSAFTVGTAGNVNELNGKYIGYLFASLNGVSKVGSYTGTGTTLSVDCGFTAGARFVLIKRTDSTGDWYVWDTARGIISANDPFLLLNSIAAETTGTDYIDPLSTGFQISSTAPAAINANGGTYIYLAIA